MASAMFVNPEVTLDALPRATEVDWQALHPRFTRCLQIRATLRWGTFLGAVGAAYAIDLAFGAEVLPLAIYAAAWGCILLAWTCAVLWPLVAVPRRGFAVRTKDIVYKAGVIWQKVQVVPYGRVQHAETGSGPVDRRFGLARLTVFTAGGSGGDLRIEGFGADTAEKLRAYIVGRLGDQSGQHAFAFDR